MNLIAWIIVGGIGGWIASLIVKSDRGIIGNIIAGIIGGLVVGWVVGFLTGVDIMSGISLVSIIAAIIGAIIVGALWSMIAGRGKSTATEMTNSASSMTKSATNTVSNTASSAANTASNTASSAANTASNAASGATNLTKGAAAGMAGAAAGAMGDTNMDQMTGAMGAMNMDQMTGMLSGILGGNMQLDANSPLGQMVMPMADSITTKLGLPKQVGQMVVVFALAKLAEMMKSKSAGKPMTKSDGSAMTGVNTDQVLGKISSGGGIDAGQLQSMGLTNDLAAKTGISEAQATQGLQMAFGELSAGLSGQKTYEGTTLPDMSMLTSMMKG